MAESIFDCFAFGFVHVFQRVTHRLALAHVGIGELLRDRPDLGKIFQLERNAGRHAIAHQLAFRVLPVINRLDGVVADFGRFGLDSSGAQNLAGVLGLFGCLLVSLLCRIRLCRDIELQQCGVGRSFVFSIGAGEYTVRLSSYGRTILSKDSSNQPQCNKKRSRNLHAEHPDFIRLNGFYRKNVPGARSCVGMIMEDAILAEPLLYRGSGRYALIGL